MALAGPLPDPNRVRRNEPTHEVKHLSADDALKLPFRVNFSPTPPEDDHIQATVADDEEWHPVAKLVWDSIKEDPCRMLMTSGDWAALVVMCETLSRELRPQPVGIMQPNPKTGEEGSVQMAVIPIKSGTLSALDKLYRMIGIGEGNRLRNRFQVELFPQGTQEGVNKGNVRSIVSKRSELMSKGASGE